MTKTPGAPTWIRVDIKPASAPQRIPIAARGRCAFAGVRPIKPLQSEAGKAAAKQASESIASLARVSVAKPLTPVTWNHRWNGLLIGDMAQPRGGPMISGHSSHQIGLDVDIWFKPMPDHVMSREERELDPAVNVVAPDGLDVDHKVWTPAYMEVVKTAAEDTSVTRIFVNAAIKKEMCSQAGTDNSWLAKVRPWWGHSEHFHVRLACPNDAECKRQPPVPTSNGCGHALDSWFRPSILHAAPAVSPKPKPSLTLAKMPAACRAVVMEP